MGKVGAPLFWVGLAQLGYQFAMWLQNGYWSSLTLAEVIQEMGLSRPWLPWAIVRLAVETMLSIEFSLLLTTVGGLLFLTGPISVLLGAWRAARVFEKARREIPTIYSRPRT